MNKTEPYTLVDNPSHPNWLWPTDIPIVPLKLDRAWWLIGEPFVYLVYRFYNPETMGAWEIKAAIGVN